jgi:DNA-binding MarR family transcriptional regulator
METLNPQIVGQAENAHGAIMDLVLAGTGLNRDRWVGLSLVTVAGGSLAVDTLTARMTGALKITPGTALDAVGSLEAAGLLTADGGSVTITDAGRSMVAAVRGRTGPILARAYAGVPAEDLATAARVLVAITEGLNRELATL